MFWDISQLYRTLNESKQASVWEERALSFVEKNHDFKDPKQIPKVITTLLSIIEKEDVVSMIESQTSSTKAVSLSVYTQYLWEHVQYKDSASSWKRALRMLRTISKSNTNRSSFSLLVDQIEVLLQDKKETMAKRHVQLTHTFLQSRNHSECTDFLKRLPPFHLRSSLLLLPQDVKEIMFGVQLFILAHYKESDTVAIQLMQHPELKELLAIFHGQHV